jgi:hypothetical protein
MRTIDSTVLIVQKVFGQDFIYMFRKKKQTREAKSTAYLGEEKKKIKGYECHSQLNRRKSTWNQNQRPASTLRHCQDRCLFSAGIFCSPNTLDK